MEQSNWRSPARRTKKKKRAGNNSRRANGARVRAPVIYRVFQRDSNGAGSHLRGFLEPLFVFLFTLVSHVQLSWFAHGSSSCLCYPHNGLRNPKTKKRGENIFVFPAGDKRNEINSTVSAPFFGLSLFEQMRTGCLERSLICRIVRSADCGFEIINSRPVVLKAVTCLCL